MLFSLNDNNYWGVIMKLTLAEPRYLKDSISIISELVNEASFKVTPNAIELVAMDPANVAMVIFKLLSTSFTEYSVDGDVEIAINLNNLKQVLRRAKPNDMITLELADNLLKVILKSNTTRTFSIPIIELEEREQKIPDLSFIATVKTSCDALVDAVEDADIVAESVSFVAEQGKMTFVASGDLSKAKIEITDNDVTKIESAEKVKSKYSIEYLKKMIAASKLTPDVTVQFSNDYPLKLEYKAIDKVLMSFILAPRVEND